MKALSLTFAGFLLALTSYILWAAEAPPKESDTLAGFSVCELQYGGYGQCASELRGAQVSAAPAWDISAGPPSLLPEKAEAIAKTKVEEFVAPYAFRAAPLLFFYESTQLIKWDATHWFYGITFRQHPAGGATGGWPSIEIFVTFDGKVGSLTLVSPPKDK